LREIRLIRVIPLQDDTSETGFDQCERNPSHKLGRITMRKY